MSLTDSMQFMSGICIQKECIESFQNAPHQKIHPLASERVKKEIITNLRVNGITNLIKFV